MGGALPDIAYIPALHTYPHYPRLVLVLERLVLERLISLHSSWAGEGISFSYHYRNHLRAQTLH